MESSQERKTRRLHYICCTTHFIVLIILIIQMTNCMVIFLSSFTAIFPQKGSLVASSSLPYFHTFRSFPTSNEFLLKIFFLLTDKWVQVLIEKTFFALGGGGCSEFAVCLPLCVMKFIITYS